MSARVILCLGSNIEPRMDYLDRAQEALCALPGTRFLASSGTDETEPVDVPAGFEGQRFLNRIVVVETKLQPMDFSRLMHRIEDDLGRVRGAVLCWSQLCWVPARAVKKRKQKALCLKNRR